MKIIHKYKNFERSAPERISRVDFVDRAGYIDTDMQLARLTSAGITLKRINAENYSYEHESVINALQDDNIRDLVSSSLMQNAHYDKRDIDNLFNTKLKKIEKGKKTNEYIKSMKDKYDAFILNKENEEKQLNMYKDISNVIKQLKEKGEI